MPGTAQANTGLLAGWTTGEDGWGADMNANLRRLDCLTQANVISRTLTAPPGSPTDGAAYIVAASPTGAWSGQAGKIARWYAAGAGWEFYTPRTGWRVWSAADGADYRYNGTTWVAIP